MAEIIGIIMIVHASHNVVVYTIIVWPARPTPPLLFIMLSLVVEGEGSSNSC